MQTGHLVYARSGSLLAVGFDPVTAQIEGSPIPLNVRVAQVPSYDGHFAVSNTGALVHVTGGSGWESTLVWVDRAGNIEGISEDAFDFSFPRVSSDGRQIAVTREQNIWVYDSERGTGRRLTSDGFNIEPVWSLDGKDIIYSSARADPPTFFDLFRIPADRGGAAQLLLARDGRQFPSSWTPQEAELGFYERTDGGLDVLVLAGGEVRSVRAESHDEHTPMFSPDGRWLAYVANESGRPEVYVMPFAGGGGSQLVSVGGGSEPLWSPHGGELFYRSGDAVMAVPYDDAATELLTPRGSARALQRPVLRRR